MTPRDRAQHRLALERLRSHLVASGPARIEPNRQDPTTAGVADEDAQALSEMLQVLASQRNRGQADLLGRIDAALRRIDATPDEYGLCRDCGEEIALRRLALMPYVERCADCQAAAEPKRGGSRKSLTDFK
jgi:DnaK suppressor protein